MKWPAEKHLQNILPRTVAFNLKGAGKPEITFSVPQRCPLPPQAHGTERRNALRPAGLPRPLNSALRQRFSHYQPLQLPRSPAQYTGKWKGVFAACLHRWLCLAGCFLIRLDMHVAMHCQTLGNREKITAWHIPHPHRPPVPEVFIERK